MKLLITLSIALTAAASFAEEAIDPERIANTIILDETGVKNLRIETAEAEEQDFESTVFAIGRIVEIPSTHSVLSSRIPGRIVEISAFEGDTVTKGQVLARVESRQPGNPPPTIDLLAPQDGLIIASHIRLGQPVEPNKELLDISDRSMVWAVAKVPENDAQKIAPGTKARIRIPALGDKRIVATMTRSGINADSETGTIQAIFTLSNETGKLQPGMRTEFSIITATRSDVLAIPRSAVQGGATKRVVFVKDFEIPNAFLKAPVVLGTRNEEFVEVISGLFPGDEVVTRGSYPLSFAGNSSGISLKEALDAAHGHEHAEDGSELTPEQIAEKKAAKHGHTDDHAHGSSATPFIIYSILSTILLAIVIPMLLKARSSS